MAESVTIRILFQATGALMCAVAAASAAAQALPDPMRPAGASTMAAAPAPGTGSVGGMVLQSVLISPTRKTAVIGGEAVNLGGKYGDATLIRITEGEVVLKNGDQLTTLKLYPNVEKKAAAAPRGKAESKRQ